MKKAILYARVSSKEQEKDGFSIPAQLKLLREYADKHQYTIAAEYTDSETAKKAGRTHFNQMAEQIRKDPSIDSILVEKTDRLTRNFQDYVLIDELINKHDIEVHMVKEGEVLSQRAKSHTKLIHGIKVVLAKNFIDNLSEETAKGMLEKARQGHWPSAAPYGYRNNKQTKTVELNPNTAPYVKRAFELYATGEYSIERLIKKLFEEGYRFQPSMAKPTVGNFHRILTRIFYTGQFEFKGMHFIGKYPPLISMGTYKKVQQLMKQRSKPNPQKRSVAYRGMVTCGHCGCAVIGDVKKQGRYVYYRCTHYKQKCPDKYIREEKLQAQFSEMVASFSITEDQYRWMVQGLKDINAQKDEEVSNRQSELNQEIKKLQRKLSQLYDDKLEGLIDKDFYLIKAKETRQQIEETTSHLERLQNASDEQMALGLSILELAKDAHSLFETMDAIEQAKLLRIVLSNCTLKDGKLSPTYKKPFDVLAENPQNERWYPVGESNPCRLREREPLSATFVRHRVDFAISQPF